MKKFFFLLILSAFLFSLPIFAAETQFVYSGSENYSLTERTDLRRYDNGKYIGLMSREVKSFIVADEGIYNGDFYVSQDTIHNKRVVTDGIHDSIHSVFKISKSGILEMIEDNGFPSFRSFPAFTNQKISPGAVWQAKAERCVDPLNTGVVTKMPIYVEYTYLRDEEFRGEDVYLLSAKWATRYGGNYLDPDGDPSLERAGGGHSATIYLRKSDCAALVVRDSVDETFQYSDGKQVQFKGTISLFTEYPPAIDKTKLIPALQRAQLIDDEGAKYLAAADSAKKPARPQSIEGGGLESGTYNGKPVNTSEWLEPFGPGKPSAPKTPKGNGAKNGQPPAASSSGGSVRIERTKAGIKLTIENLHFKPDSPELLASEKPLLDKIAGVLSGVPTNKLLVEGHTASTGNPSGEKQLSIERARAIATELTKRGINSDLFICRGSGSSKPVADNSTKEGMAKNRRVEITILE